MEPVASKQSGVDLSQASCGVHHVVSRPCPVNMENGLHARPTVMLMKLAAYFTRIGDVKGVEFTVGEHTVNPLRGFLGMLGLAAGKGSILIVTAVCEDPERATGLFNAIEAIMRHPCPEDAIVLSDAAQILGLQPEIVELLGPPVKRLRP